MRHMGDKIHGNYEGMHSSPLNTTSLDEQYHQSKNEEKKQCVQESKENGKPIFMEQVLRNQVAKILRQS